LSRLSPTLPEGAIAAGGGVERGTVVVDERQTLGGRGAYVCPTMDCLIAAFKRRVWAQALRRPVPEPAALMRQLSPYALWLTGDSKRLA